MKTISIKKTIGVLFVLHFAFFISIKAQSDTNGMKKLCDYYAQAFRYKYIFEGKIISSKYITIKTGEYTYYNYTSYLIQVQKVINGSIQKGTIEILQAASGYIYKGPDYMQSYQRPADDNAIVPSEGIYFSNQGINLKDSGVANTNSKSLMYYDGIQLSKGELVKQQTGITQYFAKLSDFYSYLSANYGVKIEQ